MASIVGLICCLLHGLYDWKMLLELSASMHYALCIVCVVFLCTICYVLLFVKLYGQYSSINMILNYYWWIVNKPNTYM